MSRRFVSTSSQYATLANAVWSNTFPVTISIWAYPDSLGNRIAFGLQDTLQSGARSVRLQQRTATDILRAEHRDGVATPAQAVSTGTYNLSAWNSFAGVFSNNASRTVYLNGGNSSTDTASVPNAMATNKVSIGVLESSGAPTAFFNGRLGHGAIHDAALNPDEMGAIGKGINPFRVRTSNVLAYWPLGHGSTEPNLAKQGGTLNMTLVNSPAIADSAPVSPLFF